MPGRARKTPKRQAYSGMPDSVVPLYEQGERVRYNGFWLNASERDRQVARLIDAFPQDVSEWVKDFLATLSPLVAADPDNASRTVSNFLYGKSEGDCSVSEKLDELRDAVLEMHRLIREGQVPAHAPAPGDPPEALAADDKARVISALDKLQT